MSRSEKRQRTERRIIDVAVELFALNGYDRTSLRAVARQAEVDPSLVVQYFGSKEGLFARAAVARWPVPHIEAAGPRSLEDAVDSLLDAFVGRADDPVEVAAVTAMLRSSLTNPEAAAATRAVLFAGAAKALLVPVVSGPDAAVRAELAAAMLMGVLVARSLLGVEPLASTPPVGIRPALRAALMSVLRG